MALERPVDPGRLSRGRGYARKGQVLSIEETKSGVTAWVRLSLSPATLPALELLWRQSDVTLGSLEQMRTAGVQFLSRVSAQNVILFAKILTKTHNSLRKPLELPFLLRKDTGICNFS
jgi:hypothetical protein